MNIAFLLGAGASKGAGLPTSHELLGSMTEQMRRSQNEGARSAFLEILRTVTVNDKNANFEDVLSATSALARKDESELWRFATGLKEPLQSIQRSDPKVFANLHQELIEMLWNEINVEDKSNFDKPYLRKLVGIARSSSQPTIFTLNYDLSIETVLAESSISYSTGFRRAAGIHETYLAPGLEYWPGGYQLHEMAAEYRLFSSGMSVGYFDQSADGESADVQLIKIHGSVDWFRIASPPIYEGGLKLALEDPIVRTDQWPSEGGLCMMIAGRDGKERLETPFSALLRRFYLGLQHADILVIIGYSFSDKHINNQIRKFMNDPIVLM